jgi:gas vesicle protein
MIKGEITKEEMNKKLMNFKEEVKNQYNSNKDQIKANLEQFKQDEGKIKDAFSNLSQDILDQLKALKDEQKQTVDTILE